MNRFREIFLAVALAFLFGLLFTYVLPALPKELVWICIFITIPVIILIIPTYNPIGDKLPARKPITASPTPSSASYKKVLKLKQPGPSNRPPTILNIVFILWLFLMLAFGIFAIYLWIVEKTAVQIDWRLFFFFLLFIVFPIWALIDALWLVRKHYKSGKSSVAKNKTIILRGGINKIFDGCLGVLNRMNAIPITIDKPKLFKGHLRSWFGNSVITIKTNKLRGGKVKIYVLSDAQWVTVTWDIFNVNQRNVNTFERLFLSN